MRPRGRGGWSEGDVYNKSRQRHEMNISITLAFA
jgi:hypothetical protein